MSTQIPDDPSAEVPLADAADQNRDVDDSSAPAGSAPEVSAEADPADAWDQQREVPLDGDEPEAERDPQ